MNENMQSSSHASTPPPHEGEVEQALNSLDYQISFFEKLKRENPRMKKYFNEYIGTAKGYKAQIFREHRLCPYLAHQVKQGCEFVENVKFAQALGCPVLLADGCYIEVARGTWNSKKIKVRKES